MTEKVPVSLCMPKQFHLVSDGLALYGSWGTLFVLLSSSAFIERREVRKPPRLLYIYILTTFSDACIIVILVFSSM
jgi:hypothetical protein